MVQENVNDFLFRGFYYIFIFLSLQNIKNIKTIEIMNLKNIFMKS